MKVVTDIKPRAEPLLSRWTRSRDNQMMPNVIGAIAAVPLLLIQNVGPSGTAIGAVTISEGSRSIAGNSQLVASQLPKPQPEFQVAELFTGYARPKAKQSSQPKTSGKVARGQTTRECRISGICE